VSRGQGIRDPLVGHLALSVDALGVDPLHDVHSVPILFRGFRRVDSGVEPQGDRCVPQVVWPRSGIGRSAGPWWTIAGPKRSATFGPSGY
jgi:hypothetical protein